MGYIQLLPIASFEFYGDEGIVFDLTSNKRFFLSRNDSEVLKQLLSGKALNKDELSKELLSVIDGLLKEGMLYEYESPVYFTPFTLRNDFEIEGILDNPPRLNCIYIEASDSCNYKCDFCKQENLIHPCETCALWSNDNYNKKEKHYDKILDAVRRLTQMTFSSVCILGGNPLLNWDFVNEIIKIVREMSIKVPIFLTMNDLSFNDEDYGFIKQNNINLRIVLTNDIICMNSFEDAKVDDHYSKMLNKFEYLKMNNIPFEVVLIKKNSKIDYIKRIIEERKYVFKEIEYIDYNKSPENTISYEERKYLKIDDAFITKKYNRCLNNNIAISLNGNIKVCPALDDVIINIYNDNIEKVFWDGKISQRWNISRDDIFECNSCGLKWLCNDCMAVLKKCKEKGKGGTYLCKKNQ